MKNWIKEITKVQNKAVKNTLKVLSEQDTCYVKMPTGTGKTVVGTRILKKFKKVLWITYSEELVFETRDRLLETNKKVGLIKGRVKNYDEKITIASINTLSRKATLKIIKKNLFDLVIFDECHHTEAVTWKRVFNHFNCKKLGLTATPIRGDGFDIKELFITCSYDMTYKEALDKKLIASQNGYAIITNSSIDGVKTVSGDYSKRDLERLVISKERDSIVLDSYKKFSRNVRNKKAICFCVSISHAYRMTKLFNKNGIKAEFLSSHTDIQSRVERDRIYNTFKNTHEIEIVCVCDILNEGKDIPDANIGLFLRPSKSMVVKTQQPGRLGRISNNKKQFLALYYVDCGGITTSSAYVDHINGSIKPLNIVFDYYKGSDPAQIKKIKDSIFLNYDEFNETYGWTRDNMIKSISDFYKRTGNITSKDLSPRNGLPGVRMVKSEFKNCPTAFSLAGISGRENFLNKYPNITKKECIKSINKYVEKNNTLAVTSLGKNGLPSRHVVEKFWGSWSKCRDDLDIRNRMYKWKTKKEIIKTVVEFKNKKRRLLVKNDFRRGSKGIPSISVIEKFWNNYLAFAKENPKLIKIYKIKTNEKYITQREENSFRVQIYINKKTTNIGTYTTMKKAITERNKALKASRPND